jgi:hypothetical protein
MAMRRTAALGAFMLLLSGCFRGGDSSTLTLNNPFWDRVHVEAVITTSDDCDYRGKGYVKTEHFIMRKDQTHDIVAPHAENICWRHDRNPNNPSPGAWSDWSRATMYPGQSARTDL